MPHAEQCGVEWRCEGSEEFGNISKNVRGADTGKDIWHASTQQTRYVRRSQAIHMGESWCREREVGLHLNTGYARIEQRMGL